MSDHIQIWTVKANATHLHASYLIEIVIWNIFINWIKDLENLWAIIYFLNTWKFCWLKYSNTFRVNSIQFNIFEQLKIKNLNQLVNYCWIITTPFHIPLQIIICTQNHNITLIKFKNTCTHTTNVRNMKSYFIFSIAFWSMISKYYSQHTTGLIH